MRKALFATAVGLALTCLNSGCAKRSAVDSSPRYKDGDSCTFTETFLSKTCGYMTGVELSGRAVFRAVSGEPQPVAGVRVYESRNTGGVMEAGFLCSGDGSGVFRVVRSVSTSDTQWCRGGIVVTERSVVPTRVVLRAQGCDDLEVEVRPNSENPFEMNCQGRPSG